MQILLNHSVGWDFCILLSEQDYPLRSNDVLAQYLWVHRDISFISVDEGECERDVSYQCGSRVVSLSGGSQYPKIPQMRYGSGGQWFAITRSMAALVVRDQNDVSTTVGTIYRDLTAVKQPDENFFQAVVLNTRFCSRYSDYTLHWTDKDSMKEVRSATSEYNILSPGVLGSLTDHFKLNEVRQQSLWAFFARKFDDSRGSNDLKERLDTSSAENARLSWNAVTTPAATRLVEVLATSLGSVTSIERLDRNKDGLFRLQTLRIDLQNGKEQKRVVRLREKLALPEDPGPLLSLRVGCQWNKTELVFEGDVSVVATSPNGEFGCETLWAVAYWRMSKMPVSQELVLVWVDPHGTPMQHAPLTVSENSVLLWHRYTAALPLPKGRWSIEIMTPTRQLLAKRSFFAYTEPSDIPWNEVGEYFEVLRENDEL
eukprot:TRINITY_DN19799_c0_g1_i1.p1 TRINITY_DN19799_c0_g1~~TRINITY_DN19799_c0_g1_i1.p1  ORF type:complete len:428 (+),score=62.31 TRINITY_DN19799_c0_g1_i1:83-1366(+)